MFWEGWAGGLFLVEDLSCPVSLRVACELPQAHDLSRPLHLWTGMWKPTPGTVGGHMQASVTMHFVNCQLLPQTRKLWGPGFPTFASFSARFLPGTLSSCPGTSSWTGLGFW